MLCGYTPSFKTLLKCQLIIVVIEIYPFTDGLFWLSYLPWIEKQNLEPILSHLSKLILLDKQGQRVIL